MPSMFERLMRQYRFDARPPEFLLTHPVTESRIADTRNRAEQARPGGIEDSMRYQLIRARVKFIYEETPGLGAKRFRAQLDENQIGRAQVCTPVTNAHLVSRLLLEQKKT